MTTLASHQKEDRGWTVCPLFTNPEFGAAYAQTLAKMESDSDAPGFSDVGIRNLLFTHILNLRPTNVLEVGSHIGTASVVMGQALKMNRYGKLTTVEPQDHYHNKVTSYLKEAEVSDYVTVVKGMSSDQNIYKQLAANAPYQIIFVDANHNYTAVIEEIRAYWPLLDTNGFMFFHDSSIKAQEFDTEGNGAVRQALIDISSSIPDFKLIAYEYPLWLNPCGAAVACKQNISEAKSGFLSTVKKLLAA